MSPSKTLCKTVDAGDSWSSNGLTTGRYLAALYRNDDTLPRAVRRDDHTIIHGYAVGIGQWYFFNDIAPAIAFGRAARMSTECSGYGVHLAAREMMFCPRHDADELVLHLTGDNVDRGDDEVEHLKRFVQGVKENAWSSHWHAPTGYITTVTNGRVTKTTQRSLPL